MIDELADFIKKRIDEATTAGNKWNYWPDKMEVVKIRRLSLQDAKEAYEAGQYMASGKAYRQIRPDQVPAEVKIRRDHWILGTSFIPAHARGQMDDITKRNIYAVFEELPDMSEYDYRNIVVVELGCKHTYVTRSPFKCYQEGECTRCGHKWACDSSG